MRDAGFPIPKLAAVYVESFLSAELVLRYSKFAGCAAVMCRRDSVSGGHAAAICIAANGIRLSCPGSLRKGRTYGKRTKKA